MSDPPTRSGFSGDDDALSAGGAFLESYSRPDSGLRRFEAYGMGTSNVLLLPGENGEGAGRHAQEAFTLFDVLEQRLSKFLPDSEVTLVNRLAAEQPVFVGEDLFRLLELSRDAWELSGGAFDPTVGALMDAWGLVDLRGNVPDADELAAARARAGMEHVELDADRSTVRFRRAGIAIDLGAIGKGWAADRLADELRGRGLPCGAIVCGRSTVVTWGTPPGEEAWTFEIVNPRARDEAIVTLDVEPGAVSSSGAYERSFRRGTHEYGHVLDPRSGRPAEGLLSATVWTERAVWGDVISTVVFVTAGAFLETGAMEKLLARWSPPGAAPRASVLLVHADPTTWGGLRLETRHLGEPAFAPAHA